MGVQSQSLFVGQYVFGATTGSPLVVNSNILGNGLYNNEVSSSTALTVTTTAGVIGSSTVTPPAGTYLVLFSCNVTASSAAGNALSVELSVGGTGQADTLRQFVPTSGAVLASFQYGSPSFNKIVTVNGSQAIAVTAVTSAGTITVTGLNFDVIRIA